MVSSRRLLLPLLLSLASLSHAVEDPEAEKHCQAFIMNPLTSPSSRTATRDLAADLAAEQWCLRVLDQPALEQGNPQIFGTILESVIGVREVSVLSSHIFYD